MVFQPKAPGIPSGNTQSRGVGFEDLSRRSDLILPSGQHISAQDPNYSIYANQPGVKAYEAPKTSASSPVAPTDLGGIDTTGLLPTWSRFLMVFKNWLTK